MEKLEIEKDRQQAIESIKNAERFFLVTDKRTDGVFTTLELCAMLILVRSNYPATENAFSSMEKFMEDNNFKKELLNILSSKNEVGVLEQVIRLLEDFSENKKNKKNKIKDEETRKIIGEFSKAVEETKERVKNMKTVALEELTKVSGAEVMKHSKGDGKLLAAVFHFVLAIEELIKRQ